MVFKCSLDMLPWQLTHGCIGSVTDPAQPQHQALNSPGRAARDRQAGGSMFTCEGHAPAGLPKAPAAAGAAGVPLMSAQGANFAAGPGAAQRRQDVPAMGSGAMKALPACLYR